MFKPQGMISIIRDKIIPTLLCKNSTDSKKVTSIFGMFLSFKEKALEDSYFEYILPYNQKYLLYYQVIGLMILLGNWALNPLDLNNNQGSPLVFNILNIIFLLGMTIYIKRKKTFKYSQISIFLLQIYFCVGYLESHQKNKAYLRPVNYALLGIFLEIIVMMALVSRCSWKINVISSLTLNIYCNFRFTDSGDQEFKGSPFLFYFLNFLIISTASYLHEKYDRVAYYLKEKNRENLMIFEHIMKEGLPSSIVITRDDDVLFYNEETKRLLNLYEDKDSIKERMKEITIIEVNKQFEQEEQRQKYIDTNDANLLEGYIDDLQGLRKQTLLEKLKDKMKHKAPCYFNKYYGIYESVSNDSKNKPVRNLEIKLGKIAWEGTDAVIAILTEDQTAVRLNYLHDQARYKDKLLATVSHDLRTPLNGVIGILDSVIDGINDDKSLKKR
jgi:hypothetical protein